MKNMKNKNAMKKNKRRGGRAIFTNFGTNGNHEIDHKPG